MLRFFEYFGLNAYFTIKFKSSFFSFSPKSLISFNNFKLKIDINLFFYTKNYVNFFRRFKYREYLKKSSLVQFTPVFFFNSYSIDDSYLFNFIRNDFLIYCFRPNDVFNLHNLCMSFPVSHLDLSVYSPNVLTNAKFISYIFIHLKQYLRIYFVI